jgi:hypothetical protein
MMKLWLLKFLLLFGYLTVDRQVGTWNLFRVIFYECLRVKFFIPTLKDGVKLKGFSDGFILTPYLS